MSNKKKILIVDDNVVIRKTLSMKLTANGYDVLTAEDGGEAVSLVRLENPDLMLLDLSFPPDVGHGGGVPWDGFLIMTWLRRLDEARDLPIIVITSSDPAEFEAKALRAGAISFFQKPIDNERLLALIASTLSSEPEPLVATS